MLFSSRFSSGPLHTSGVIQVLKNKTRSQRIRPYSSPNVAAPPPWAWVGESGYRSIVPVSLLDRAVFPAVVSSASGHQWFRCAPLNYHWNQNKARESAHLHLAYQITTQLCHHARQNPTTEQQQERYYSLMLSPALHQQDPPNSL